MWLHWWPGCCCHLIFGLDPFTVIAFTVRCMLQLPVDLERFTQRLQLSGNFVRDIWISFEVSILIAAYLDSFSQTRLFISCLVIQVDRTDVALGATSIRLQCHSQPWTVPTPPLQSFSLTSSSSDLKRTFFELWELCHRFLLQKGQMRVCRTS